MAKTVQFNAKQAAGFYFSPIKILLFFENASLHAKYLPTMLFTFA